MQQPQLQEPLVKRKSSKSLSRFGSRLNTSEPPPAAPLENSGNDSDEEYGDVDKTFSLKSMEYPERSRLPPAKPMPVTQAALIVPLPAPAPVPTPAVGVDALPRPFAKEQHFQRPGLGRGPVSGTYHPSLDTMVPRYDPYTGRPLSVKAPTPPINISISPPPMHPVLYYNHHQHLAKTTSWTSHGSSAELEELLSRGYTEEQAMEICRRRASSSNNTHASHSQKDPVAIIRMNAKELKKVRSAPPVYAMSPADFYYQQQEQVVRAAAQQMHIKALSPQSSPHGHEKGSFFPEDEPLIVEESYSYGRKQSPPPPSSRSMSRTSSGHEYMQFGMVPIPNDSVMMRSAPSVSRTSSRNNMNSHSGQQSLSRTHSGISPRNAPHGITPEYLPQQLYHHQPPVHEDLPRVMSADDAETLRVAQIIAQQEEEFGVNMYDALVDADEPRLKSYIALGLSVDDAILKVYEDKGYRSPRNRSPVPVLSQGYPPEEELQPPPTHDLPYYLQPGFHHGPPPAHAVAVAVDAYPVTTARSIDSNHQESPQRTASSAPNTSTIQVGSGNSSNTLMPGIKRSNSFKSLLGLASKVKLDQTKEEKALQKKLKYKDTDVITIMTMGFSKEQAIQALVENSNDVPRATNSLLQTTR